MNRTVRRCNMYFFGCWLLFVPLGGAHATDSTVYSFTGAGDGGNPPSGLISGGKGALPRRQIFYGTTAAGGADGYGTVFEVTSKGSESVIYSFTGGSDGSTPRAGLIADGIGRLYGTTEAGGTDGYGVVYRVTTGGGETVLYSFAGGSDGAVPHGAVVMDGEGNLYGTTEAGGADDLGVVFKLTPGGTETVLHSFAGSDGASPMAGLVIDASGNLYGTTEAGGTDNLGVVFKVTPGGSETVLHSFSGSDGATPMAGLIIDKRQNLIGTTAYGGAADDGTVFKISPKGKETVLHAFSGSDGANPLSAVFEKHGLLYGTTSRGGADDSGTVYTVPSRGGMDTVLYSFSGGSDGALPEGGLLDTAGGLFGTTYSGGDPGCDSDDGCGVIFEITP